MVSGEQNTTEKKNIYGQNFLEVKRIRVIILGAQIKLQSVMDGGRTANGLRYYYGGQKDKEEDKRRN